MDAFEEYLRVFRQPGAVRAGLMYYREVFSPEGRAAGAARSARRLPMPILTMGGEYADGDNLLHTMRQFSDNVRNRVFEGIGHHLPEECPEDMVREIVDFWHAATPAPDLGLQSGGAVGTHHHCREILGVQE